MFVYEKRVKVQIPIILDVSFVFYGYTEKKDKYKKQKASKGKYRKKDARKNKKEKEKTTKTDATHWQFSTLSLSMHPCVSRHR